MVVSTTMATAASASADAEIGRSAAVARPGLVHRVYHRFDDAEALRAPWDGLLEKIGGDAFASFDWCRLWWKHYGDGRRLEIHAVWQGEELIGVLPLVRERWWWGAGCKTVRLAGCDTNPGSISLAVDPHRLTLVLRRVIEALAQDGGWDLICIHRIAGYYDHAGATAEALASTPAVGRVCCFDDAGPHIVFDLPDSFDGWLATLTTKERSNVRRREKLLGKDHQFEYAAPESETEIDALAGQLAELHQTTWQNRGLPGSFVEWPAATEFYRDCIRTFGTDGRLLLTSLTVDGEVIGGEYCVRHGRRLHWILSARDDGERWKLYSPGRLAFVDLVRRAIDLGVTQIDGLAGDFHYKRLLGGTLLSERSIWAYRRGALPRLRVGVFRFMATLLHIVYAKGWAFGIGRKLGWVRYPHLRAWIRSVFDRRLRSRGRWLDKTAVRDVKADSP